MKRCADCDSLVFIEEFLADMGVCESCAVKRLRAENEELRRKLAESERERLAYKRALEGTGCAWDVGNRRDER